MAKTLKRIDAGGIQVAALYNRCTRRDTPMVRQAKRQASAGYYDVGPALRRGPHLRVVVGERDHAVDGHGPVPAGYLLGGGDGFLYDYNVYLEVVMLFSAEQLTNAKSSILVTLLGIVMLVRSVQYQNARSPMSVTPSGI